MSNLLVNGNYRAVLALGDNQYECGSYVGFQQSYDPSWGRVKSVTRPVVGNAAHADVVLNGHDYIYERFAPQTPAGVADPANGIREFIAGTGGANHTSLLTTPANNSEIRNATTYGALQLGLHASSYDWRFVPEAGGTFTDSGTSACHDTSIVLADDSGNLSKWTSVAGLVPSQQDVHAGSWAARATSTAGTAAWAWTQLPSNQNDLTATEWFKVASQGPNVADLMKLRTATGAALLTLFSSETGVLGYQNNVTTASTYSSTPVSKGIWHRLDVHVVVNGTQSQTEVWLDGAPVPGLTATGVSLGTTAVGRIQIGENIAGRTYDLAIDDVAVAAGRGT